ncbi:MAG: 2-dehydropantoate 2-reductase, partial [Herminiimonas sp.]|nr:2-dehydropantoate 2-reductase [Herminiimonas sp.]
MNITMIGVGAIGGLIGARLARSGARVSAVARGATLVALQAHGLRVENADGSAAMPDQPIHAVADAGDLGNQDLVVLAVKATQLAEAVAAISPLIGPHTLVMSAMNGVPWWFFDQAEGPQARLKLNSLDPHGVLARAIPAGRTLGCVVHLSAACPQPGTVRLNFGNRLIVGSACGDLSEAAAPVVAALTAGGFDAAWSSDIRRDIWYKLWGNMTINPISVL